MTATMERTTCTDTTDSADPSEVSAGERARSALVTAARFAGNLALATVAVIGLGGDVDDLIDPGPVNRRSEAGRTPER